MEHWEGLQIASQKITALKVADREKAFEEKRISSVSIVGRGA
jgi:hypothetical protein